jgi:hypothetical protein
MDELEKKVKAWILKNGYLFEMKVANLFKKSNFKVSQSLLYKDIDSNKLRELDIISYFNFKNNNLHNAQLERHKPFATRNAEVLHERTKALKENRFELLFPNLFDAGFNFVTALRETKDFAYSSILNTKVFSQGNSNVIPIVSSKNLENFIEQLKEDTLFFFDTYKKELNEVFLSNLVNKPPISFKIK